MGIRRIAFIGWRGMLGSVLLERMRAERDFEGLTPTFYSTSQVGGLAPETGLPRSAPALQDAFDIAALTQHGAILTCQGSDYTKQVLPQLREQRWAGYWIDAAREKRMDEDSISSSILSIARSSIAASTRASRTTSVATARSA